MSKIMGAFLAELINAIEERLRTFEYVKERIKK